MYPVAGLVRDKAGNLYGTTELGGGGLFPSGGGIVFKLDTMNNETALFTFDLVSGDSSGGYNPQAGLIIDAAGNLYGVAASGGSTACNAGGCGVVFALSPTGQETVLHRFLGPPNDGQTPLGGLVTQPKV